MIEAIHDSSYARLCSYKQTWQPLQKKCSGMQTKTNDKLFSKLALLCCFLQGNLLRTKPKIMNVRYKTFSMQQLLHCNDSNCSSHVLECSKHIVQNTTQIFDLG